MMIFQKHSLCLAFIFFVGCDNSRHIQYYRTPKKDFGINQSQSTEENQHKVISNLSWELSIERVWRPNPSTETSTGVGEIKTPTCAQYYKRAFLFAGIWWQ